MYDWSLLQLASVLGFTGVGMGALGAHKLAPMLIERNLLASWQSAVTYQLFHAAALVGLADLKGTELSGRLLGVGSMVFSGSIYLLCLGIGPRKILGPATPIGGLFMMGGWALIGISASRNKSKAE